MLRFLNAVFLLNLLLIFLGENFNMRRIDGKKFDWGTFSYKFSHRSPLDRPIGKRNLNPELHRRVAQTAYRAIRRHLKMDGQMKEGDNFFTSGDSVGLHITKGRTNHYRADFDNDCSVIVEYPRDSLVRLAKNYSMRWGAVPDGSPHRHYAGVLSLI